MTSECTLRVQTGRHAGRQEWLLSLSIGVWESDGNWLISQ